MVFVNRGVVRLLLFVLGYGLFLILGATVFSAIEGPEEFQKVQDLRNMRSGFLHDHTCVSGTSLKFVHEAFSAEFTNGRVLSVANCN